MKILLLSDANSAHTQRWVKYLYQQKINLAVFSIHPPQPLSLSFYNHLNVPVFYSSIHLTSKAFYPLHIFSLHKAIKQFQPNILHAHYASSYGLLASLSKFHPLIVSVWGSDVYEFPYLNYVTKKTLEYNLKTADIITSTSHVMAKQTQLFTNKNIQVVPFGVDTNLFKTFPVKRNFHPDDIVIGIAKNLSEKYGIDVLLHSFAVLKQKLPTHSLKLIIIGDGPKKNEYITLAKNLNISQDTLFTGFVPNEKIPEWYNQLDIYVSLSIEESFGVSAIEAMSCGLPVVLSDIPAYREITHQQFNDFIVPINNPEKTALAIQKLILNPNTKKILGAKAREIVLQHYDIQQNVKQLIDIYQSLM